MKNFTHFFRVLTLCLVTLVSSGAWATVQTYQKVTSAPTDWSGEYLIVYEAGNCAMNGSLTTLDAVSNTQAVTIKDNAISLDDAYSFTIASMEGGYSIQAKSGKYIGNAANSNALTSSDHAMVNTLSLFADGDVLIVGEGGAYLRFNSASNQNRFRYYKSSSYTSQKAIHLYKKTSTVPTDVLKSLTVSGTPTKTTYYAGDEFDPAGLTVTGTYSESGNKTITNGIVWSVEPETLTAGTTSVSVVATVGDVESSAYTVNGLTVTEKPVPTGYAGVYTSGEGLLTTTGGTSASSAKVKIDGTEYEAIKAGTGKVAGAIKMTVPAGTKTLHFHALGWNGETVKVTVNGQTYSLTSDTGVSGNSPFTLTADPSEEGYFTLDTNNATALEITFAATSGNRFVLFGVNAEAGELPTTPSISASNVDIAADATSGEIAYTINNPVTGKTLSASTTASWITISQVATDKVTFTTTANTGTAERTADITLKYEGATDKVVTVTQAKPVPTYASLAALVAAGEPTEAGEPVNVTLTHEEITKFQTSGSYTNGVYLMVGTQEIEIYCKDVPDTWEVGGTISGTLTNCTWKKYGSTWELCPTSWDLLEYTAPAPGTLYTITWSVNGTTTTEDVEEGDPINFAPATVPAGYTDYVFRGWVTSETVSGTTEPTYVTEATATDNVTYYAVFAKKTTTGGTASIEKLNGTSTLANGDHIAIFASETKDDVTTYYGMKHETVSTSYVNYYVLNAEPTYETVTADALNWWTLNNEDGNWTLGDATNGYLANSNNNLYADNDAGTYLTIAWDDTNSAFTIKNDSRWIGCRADLSGDNKYKYRGASANEKPQSGSLCYLDFYRITEGTITYSDFTTSLVAPEAYTLEVSQHGYSTLYLDKAVEIPEDVTVYYCTYKNAESLSAVKIDGDYIPANTGVVVEAKAGTYAFNYTDQQVDEFENPVLTGVLVDTPVQEIRERDHNAPVYVLSIVDGKVGFYKYADTETLKANRAFFEGAEDAPPVNGFILDFNGTEGINTVVRATNLKAGYDLQGRRINQMQKGINILNGKKIIK